MKEIQVEINTNEPWLNEEHRLQHLELSCLANEGDLSQPLRLWMLAMILVKARLQMVKT